MRITYVDKAFRQDSLDIIAQANRIVDDYQRQGYDLTLRQVYYQFVARGLIPNSDRSYKRLGSIVNDARLAGLMSWHSIQDRTRYLRSASYWTDPEQIINAAVEGFQRNLWLESDQEYRPEVWVEKDALVGVIGRVCDDLQVPYMSCRGYVSQSEMWAAGRRMRLHVQQGRTPVVIHLGDHDPSGIDMTRDIQERLSMFSESYVDVRRIALNMDQVEQYEPPPNPAKITDSRAEAYIAEHGDESWELDALEPSVISDLIRVAVEPLVDQAAWDEAYARDEADREDLRVISSNWDEIAQHARDNY